MRTSRAPAAPIVAILLGLGCGDPPRGRAPGPERVESCRYDVELEGAGEFAVSVAARCEGGRLSGFRAAERRMLPFISDVRAENMGLSQNGDLFRFSEPNPRAALRYRVDLGRAAREFEDFDFAERIGASLIAPASSFLMTPEPLADTPVTIHVKTTPGTDFATGLRREEHGFGLDAHEIPFATYTVFGRFSRETIELSGAELDVVTLDAPIAAAPEVRSEWIRASARAVADFYGRFPVPRALVGIVPASNRDEVVFGKVLPESAPGIVMRIGEHAEKSALHRDWMLVHELFHLGFPSFRGEGKWLDEGLATYFEPIIRARAGFISEADVWREFASDMPYGLKAVQHGLENARDYRGMYWGGALVCLLADVEARRSSRGLRGLEDGIVRVLEAGGNASEVWSLARTIELIDAAFERPILAPLSRAYGSLGLSPDLRALFQRLGVRETPHGVEFDDAAPLAAVRRTIVHGSAQRGDPPQASRIDTP